MQPEVENTLEVTTNLMTNTYGTPRVYYETTNPSGYQECNSVTVSRNESGYMTITCKVTPTQAATGVTLYIVPKGSADDIFCTDNTYQPDTSDCEAGEWKWGSLVVEVPDIVVTIFGGITTMQEMPKICTRSEEGDTKRLVDTRDGKMYWVAKLADGNCWMIQNLDLDIDTNTTYTSADTNVTSNWTPIAGTTTTISGYNTSDTGQSYNPGDVYYENTSGSDQHYHAGNYYQWSAATAGYTGASQSPSSICPAGWTLPSQSQFQELINHGLDGYNFMNAPYYLLRGGLLNDSSLNGVEAAGYYWSSTPYASIGASYLYLGLGYIYASADNYRYIGCPVRCVTTE